MATPSPDLAGETPPGMQLQLTDPAMLAAILTIVLCIANNKGGIGKTTTAVFLAYALAIMGYRVLLVDMDPSCNATYTLTGVLNEEWVGTLYEVLRTRDPRSIWEIMVPARGHKNLYVAPSSVWLQDTEMDLVSSDLREFRLREALLPVMGYFHYVVIDTPPNLNLLTINSLIACTHLLIPVTLKAYGLIGIAVLLKRLDTLRKKFAQFGVTLPLLGVLITQVRKTVNANERRTQIYQRFQQLVFQAEIPLNERVEEANDQEEAPYLFDPRAPGVIAYRKATEEVLSRAQR